MGVVATDGVAAEGNGQRQMSYVNDGGAAGGTTRRAKYLDVDAMNLGLVFVAI